MVGLGAELDGAQIQVGGHEVELPQVVDERGEVGGAGVASSGQVGFGEPGEDGLVLVVCAVEEEAGKEQNVFVNLRSQRLRLRLYRGVWFGGFRSYNLVSPTTNWSLSGLELSMPTG